MSISSSSSSGSPPSTPQCCCCQCDDTCSDDACQSDCPDTSAQPVHYATGELRLRFTDLSFSGYGREWLQQRSYANITLFNEGSGNGFGWHNAFVPRLNVSGMQAQLSFGPLQSYYLQQISPGTFAAPSSYYYVHTLMVVYSAATTPPRYEARTARGRTYLFSNASGSSPFKPFIGCLEPNGDQIDAVYESPTSLRLTSVSISEVGQQTGLIYTYDGGSDRFATVTLRIKGQDIRRATYSYYGSGDGNGSAGDLKTVLHERNTGGVWESLGTAYHRYYLAGQAKGFAHGLRFVVSPEAYARLVGAGITPADADDEQLKGYADYYFEYDSQQRVALERTGGGAYSYTYQYSANPNPPSGFSAVSSSSASSSSSSSSTPFVPPAEGETNQWRTKTIVTMPDGTQEIVYCNTF